MRCLFLHLPPADFSNALKKPFFLTKPFPCLADCRRRRFHSEGGAVFPPGLSDGIFRKNFKISGFF